MKAGGMYHAGKGHAVGIGISVLWSMAGSGGVWHLTARI